MLFKIIKIIISLCISKTKKAVKNQIEQLRENSMVFSQVIEVSRSLQKECKKHIFWVDILLNLG